MEGAGVASAVDRPSPTIAVYYRLDKENAVPEHEMLVMENVSKTVPSPGGADPIRILRGIDLTLASGESVAVTGPSGSGKSTLLNLAGGLDRPTEGRVRIGGRDLAVLKDAEGARLRNLEIGFVFQLHHLLPQCSALENVLVPTLAGWTEESPEALASRARELLRRVGLEERLDHRPGQLSGGECQRVAVARALVLSPRVVLADEPTGSLDGVSAGGVEDLLFRLCREDGVSLLLVTHAEAFSDRAGRRLALVGGTLREGA